MPSISKMKTTKTGKQFYEVRVHTTGNKTYCTRWYVPDGWSQKAIDRELTKQAAEFERKCKAGEVETRKDRIAREALEKAEAEAEAEAKARREAEEAKKIQTLRQYTEAVFLPNKAGTIKENTRAYIQNALAKRIYPEFGDAKIDEITTTQLKSWIFKLEASGLKGSTINGTRNVLHSIFEEAVDDETIGRNPLTNRVKRAPEEKSLSGSDKAFTEKEIQHIKTCLHNEPTKWEAMINLFISTGMRRGEAVSLLWENVDYTTSTITVKTSANYTKARGVYIGPTKSGRIREVPLTPAMAKLLKEWHRKQSAQHLSRYVFNQDDSPDMMFPDSPTRYLSRFGKRYGIDNCHPHRFRHTFASILATNGIDPKTIAELLGHGDATVTMRNYIHSNDEVKRKAVSAFAAAIGE